jgi:predicted transcriptional regulator
MNILLSVRPEFAEAIVNETKRYEFRRTIFRKRNIEKVLIYSTAPVHRITGAFTIGVILRDQPARLWERLQDQAGISEEDFFEYFGGRSEGYAIEVREVQSFRKPLDPWELNPNFVPPQSFRYVDWQLDVTGEGLKIANP